MPKYNRDKPRKNETDSIEIKIQSIYGVLRAEMIGKKFNSYIGLESLIKAIQIKENIISQNLSVTLGFNQL